MYTTLGLITFDAIQLSEPKVDWFNTIITSSNTTGYLKEYLINGTAVGVSDGSYFPIQEVGACKWTSLHLMGMNG